MNYPEEKHLDAGVTMAKVPEVLLTWHDCPGRLSRRDPRYAIEAFYRCKALYLARWLHRHLNPPRPVWVWGAGRPTRRRAGYLADHGVRISGYIDIDPRKIGRQLSGAPVLGPDDIPDRRNCFVLGYVAKRGARDLARKHLRSREFVEGVDFLMTA